jgi:outer membrane biogenesis lipoprotein LolB
MTPSPSCHHKRHRKRPFPELRIVGGTPKAKKQLFLSCIILLFALGACTPRPPLVEPGRPVALEDWVPALRARAEYWKSYQARVHLRAQTADKKINLDALILAKLPDMFRLEGFRMGQTAGVLTMKHGQSALLVPSEKTLYTAARSEDLIDHFLGITVPLGAFGYSLSASLPPDQLDGLQITYQAPVWMGYAKNSADGWSYAWLFHSPPREMQSAEVQRGTANYSLRYEPPVPLSVQEIPQRITFSSAQWEIELKVQEITPVRSLDESVFTIDAPAGVRQVDLERIPLHSP